MLKLAEEDPNKYKMAIVPARNIPFRSPQRLPEGWVVEEVPRNTRGGYVDKVYSVSEILTLHFVIAEDLSLVSPSSNFQRHLHYMLLGK